MPVVQRLNATPPPEAKERERDQASLFSREAMPFDWQAEWWGMPEFVMGDQGTEAPSSFRYIDL